jgi:hypothetical protein
MWHIIHPYASQNISMAQAARGNLEATDVHIIKKRYMDKL